MPPMAPELPPGHARNPAGPSPASRRFQLYRQLAGYYDSHDTSAEMGHGQWIEPQPMATTSLWLMHLIAAGDDIRLVRVGSSAPSSQPAWYAWSMVRQTRAG